MSVVKFDADQWRKIEGALICLYRNGCWHDDPIRWAVTYSDKGMRDLADERHREPFQTRKEGEQPKSDETIGERSLRWAVHSWRIANAVAYAVQYGGTFDPKEEESDERPQLDLAGLRWLHSELRSVRCNLATNGGRVFCPAGDLDILDRLIEQIGAHRLRDYEYNEQRQREESAAHAKMMEKVEEEKRAKLEASRAAKNGGSVAP